MQLDNCSVYYTQNSYVFLKIVVQVCFFVTSVLLKVLIALYKGYKRADAFFRLFHKVVLWPKKTYVRETDVLLYNKVDIRIGP